MKAYKVLVALISVLIICSFKPICHRRQATITYERNPWFTNHNMPQTISLLLKYAHDDLSNKDIGDKDYRIITDSSLKKPHCNIDTCKIDNDYYNRDVFCVVIFEEDDRLDTLALLTFIDSETFLYNGRDIYDRSYVRSLINYLCKKDEEFAKQTKFYKKLLRKIDGKRLRGYVLT